MSRHDSHIRAKAIRLRTEQHMTLDEIVECLQLPKTTIYGWIKDIPIPWTNRQSEAQCKGTQASQAKYAALREQAYQQGLDEAPELLKDLTFRDFVVLYMAEGTKRKRNAVEFVNSDPKMILLASRWIGKLTDRKVEYRIQYHADQDLLELQQYWGKLLNVSPDTIRLQRKSNSGQLEGRKFRSVYGVMTVRISDTYFRARLEAWMDFIKSQW